MQNHYALWQAENYDQGPTRRNLRRLVWQRKWWVLLFVALFVGLGLVYDQYGTPIYEGSARLLLQQVNLVGTITKKMPHGVEFVDTQTQVLLSPVLVRDAVEAVGSPTLDPSNVEGLLMILDSLKVERIPQTDVVWVGFRHEDPQVALGVVQEMIKQYEAYLVAQQKLNEEAAPARADLLKIQEGLWKAQADEKSLAERYGPKHPLLRGARETVAMWENVLQQHMAQLPDSAESGADLVAKTGGVKIAVLNGPDVSGSPVWPNPLIVIPLSVLLGLLVGVGAVTLFDRGDDSLRMANDVETALEMRACAEIPASNGSGIQNIHRYALESPHSALARAIYDLGYQLCSGVESEQGPIVQVTSATEQSGKTTVVANLAFMLAQHGKKVCVVDADLRHGIVHRIFEVSHSKGLSSLSKGTVDLEDLIQTSPLASVDVLTKGPAIRNPLHLLAQPQVERMFDALRWQYDIILVDTPPLLKVSDASLLSPLADTVLVVLQSRVSSAASVRRAIDMLKSVGTKNVGLVLNGSAVAAWMVNGEEAPGRRINSKVASSVSAN